MNNKVKNGDLPASEMTKREDIAKAIIAGIMGREHGYTTWQFMASDAVDAADALLEALEKSK